VIPRRAAAFFVLVAAVFLWFHLRYIQTSLEDLDSVNFALGVRHFDVAEHQPHPPGYPLYILIAKAIHAAIRSEAAALSVLSIVAGSLGIFAAALLFARIARAAGDAGPWWAGGTLVAVTSPMYWFTAARPLSDMTGLAAALGVQALILAAETPRALVAAAFAAAFAAGIRSQIVWLTAPLLAFRIVERLHHGVDGRTDVSRSRNDQPSVSLASTVAAVIGSYAAGILLWFIPLVIAAGGPAAYWKALAFQGSADIGDIQMLATRHGVRDIRDALYYAFVAPWATTTGAAAVLALAVVGAVWAAIRRPRALWLLSAAFGPYFVFDLLFQETFTSRYALPLVLPIAFLAANGARVLPWRSGAVALAALCVFDAHTGGRSVAAFARVKPPAFALLDDMGDASRRTVDRLPPPVLAMDRGQSISFRRPMLWEHDHLPTFERVLPAPPQHEWLEAVKYWTGGGRAPVWFVVDPKRSMMDLVQHGSPIRYQWTLPTPVLISGARPDEVDWYRVEAPEWFVGEGWALTPEAAGVADSDHRGPSRGGIDAWISGAAIPGNLVIGGRNLGSVPAHLRIVGTTLYSIVPTRDLVVAPGFFLQLLRLTTDVVPHGGDKLHVSAPPDDQIAIEQFDVSAARTLLGYGAGWHEQELDPRSGRRWRWLSERGQLQLVWPARERPEFATKPQAPRRVLLHLEGESPRRYFSRGSRLIVRAADHVLFDEVLATDFVRDIPLPDGTKTISLETDQTYVPAEGRSLRRSPDHRRLGLRIFTCELRRIS